MIDDFKKYGFLLSNNNLNLYDNRDLKSLFFLAKRRIFLYKLLKITGLNKFFILFKRKILGIKTPKFFLVELLRKGDYKRIKSLKKISNNHKIISIVKKYLGNNVKLTGCGLWYSEPIEGELTKSQLFHFDKPGNYLKVFISLSKIDKDNGPFTFIDAANSSKFINSQNKKQIFKMSNLKQYERKYFDSEINRNLEKKFTSKFGDIVFCDTTRCLHQGARVKKGYRIMLMLVYSLEAMDKDKSSKILK